jgi:hypothetical protein
MANTTTNVTAFLPDYALPRFNRSYFANGTAVLLATQPGFPEELLLYIGLCIHGIGLIALIYAHIDRKVRIHCLHSLLTGLPI